jgi:hypothetical protein
VYKGSCFTAFLSAFVVIALEDGHSNCAEMKFYCSFDLHLFIAREVEHFFMCLLGTCTSFLKIPYSINVPISSLGC